MNLETTSTFRKKYINSHYNDYELSVSTNSLVNTCMDRHNLGKRKHTFNTKISVQPTPMDQQQSGRCWLFAAMNVVRSKMIESMSLTDSFQN